MNLKEKTVTILKKFQPANVVSYLEKGESKSSLYFRGIMAFVCFDIFLVFVLADLSPFHLVNPIRFLENPPHDTRSELELCYARSSELMDAQTGEGLEALSIMLTEPVEQLSSQSDSEEILRQNSLLIIHQLSEDPGTVWGRRLYTDTSLIKDLWFFKGALYLHLDPDKWKKLAKGQKKLIEYCFEYSLKENISAIESVDIVFR